MIREQEELTLSCAEEIESFMAREPPMGTAGRIAWERERDVMRSKYPTSLVVSLAYPDGVPS